MKINFLTLAFCLCMVSVALAHGALAQDDDPFTASPFVDYDRLSQYAQYATQEPQPGLDVASDQQAASQPLPESGTGQTTAGPGGSSPDGVNGIFLYLEGAPGGSTVESHKDWIDVLSFNYGIRNPSQYAASGSGAAAGRQQFGDLVITKMLDRASPQLYLMASNGKHIPEARLEIIKGGTMVLRYKLSDVTVGAVETAGDATDRILDKVSLKYGKIEWTYSTQDPTGRLSGEVKTGWDLTANSAL